MINYAHRGASAYAPENTMSAFCMGLNMGANGIETDVQKSKDGVLVLHHDHTLTRTAGVDRRVCEMNWAELAALDVGGFKHAAYKNERLVKFEDFLYYFGGKDIQFAIEIKQPGIELDALRLARAYVDDSRLTMTSFMWDSLIVLSRERPKPRLGFLTREYSEELLNRLIANGIDEYCPEAARLTPDMAARVRERGLGLRAWGVKTEELMLSMCELGVDGMTVNFPDKLKALLCR